ncbi:Protein of unknown function DUF1665 [Macleaya cordata]|uniref:RRP15-like protein n=1 Tax=Macleaya cordata TaxID=56857 RepID=A0A200PY32_MACCD|nr:Protein of unknown function DUF1665 [Macleaya cordata]
MALETDLMETKKVPTRRKPRQNKGGKAKKGEKVFRDKEKKARIDKKMQKLFCKRARDYNSDDDDDDDNDELEPEVGKENGGPLGFEEASDANSSGEERENGPDADEEKGDSEDEGYEIQPGITKFTEGCRAFKIAFNKITKKNVSDDPLGPVLSGHKKLVAEKLAEEESERKVKGLAKKEKHSVREQGHVMLENFLGPHEKFLIGVATKGVVKLFNAVSKAQNAQKGLNPSRSKDAKVLGKRRRSAFLSELRKKTSQAAGTSSKGTKSTGAEDDDGPAWAPLRDSYMLTSSKLKNWDKMEDTSVAHDTGGMPPDSSSDED